MRSLKPESALSISPVLADAALLALPALRDLAGALASAGPALEPLEHNKPPEQCVRPPTRRHDTAVFDFGHSVWAHPFTSLTVHVGALCREWETDGDDSRIGRIVDCYLEVWSDLTELRASRDGATGQLDGAAAPLRVVAPTPFRKSSRGASQGGGVAAILARRGRHDTAHLTTPSAPGAAITRCRRLENA